MADESDPTAVPSQEDLQRGADVVQAGKAAAAAEPDPERRRGAAADAIRDEAQRQGWKLTAAEADMIAAAMVAKSGELADAVADRIQERGGFDKLPGPVAPPPAPTGTGDLPAQPPAADPPTDGTSAPPPAGDERPPAHGASGFATWFRGGAR